MAARVKIKICGLSRLCDVAYVNEARPDFAGFIINVPKSRRNVDIGKLAVLREKLDPAIVPVGVFVNEAPEIVARLLNNHTIALAQLHGTEDEAYIKRLRELTGKKCIKAFSIATPEDVRRAQESSADYILLDHGSGGTGQSFAWDLASGIKREWFLAGGLSPDNLADAIKATRPWAVDLSSGVETDGYKDRAKVLAAVEAVRKMQKHFSVLASIGVDIGIPRSLL